METPNVYTIETHPQGNGTEKYLITTTGHLEWMEPDLMVIDDLDFVMSKQAKSSLAKYLSFTGKLMKLLSNNGEEHNKFKSIFASIASAQNLEIVAKIENDEETNQPTIMGFFSPRFMRILNDTLKLEVIPALLNHPNLRLRYSYVNADDATYVFHIEGEESSQVDFAGRKWHPGFVLNNSSIGHYSLSVTPALVPHNSNSFYSLPFSIDNVILYPDSLEQIKSPQFVNNCLEMASWCIKGVVNWNRRLHNSLSVSEYQSLMSNLLPRQDLIPEQKIIGRLALIYDAHNISSEDGRPSRQWAKTADSGTLISEFLKVALDIDLESDWECCPVYGVGSLLDNDTDLEGVADNTAASSKLDNLDWPVNVPSE